MKKPSELLASQRQKLRSKIRQAAKVESHSDAKPSEVTDVYWLNANRKKGEYLESTGGSGKLSIMSKPAPNKSLDRTRR